MQCHMSKHRNPGGRALDCSGWEEQLKVLLKIVAGLIGALVIGVIGLMVLGPSEYHVERSIVIDAPAEKVFPQVNDLRNWRGWMVWTRRDPQMKIVYSGPDQGVGAVTSWDSETQGKGELTIVKSNPPHEVHYKLYFPDFDSTSQTAMKLEAVSDGTQVTWSDRGKTGLNPMMKFFALMMDSMVGPDFEAGLVNLKELVEKQPDPAPAEQPEPSEEESATSEAPAEATVPDEQANP